jgi:hypothetical protein
MNRLHTILTVAALAGALLATPSCGTLGGGNSGYLSDYSKLTQNPDFPGDRSAKRYIAPGDALLDYDRLLIEPYSLQPRSGTWLGQIDRASARELVDELRRQMITVVDPYYAVVGESGAGVLRLRVAITDLGFRDDKRDPEKAETISFEAEFLDSRTGEQMAAAIRTLRVGEDQSAYDVLAQGLLTFMNRVHGADQ